jgi:protein-tyrosine phosphatase
MVGINGVASRNHWKTEEIGLNYIERAREVMEIEIAGMEKVRNELGEGFTQAVDAMLETIRNGGKIVVAGSGRTGTSETRSPPR